MSRQQEQGKKHEDRNADQNVREPKPATSSAETGVFTVMLVGMIQELGNVFGLELAEDRMVQGAGGAEACCAGHELCESH